MVSRLEYSISKTWDTHRELSRKNFSYPYNFIKLYFSHGSQTVRTLSFQDSVSHPRGLGGGRGATQEFLGGDLPLGRTLRYCRPLVRLFATTPHTRLMHIIFFWGPDGNATLMSPNKGETTVHGWYCFEWPCACTRYWPGQYLSQCLNEYLRQPLSQQGREGEDPGNEVA